MIFHEHAMLGGTAALAVGAHRRHGWGIVGVGAVAAVVPDWDAVSLLFGTEAYSRVHRLWGHNLLVAGLTGAACGLVGYLLYLSTSFSGHVDELLRKLEPKRYAGGQAPPPFAARVLVVWVLVGIVAGVSHLPADMIYGGGPAEPWPVQLFWPFSERGWSYPLFPWGDRGLTLLFIGEMFALYRWPRRGQFIAWLTLAALAAYAVVRRINWLA
jgi:hypothetical protein